MNDEVNSNDQQPSVEDLMNQLSEKDNMINDLQSQFEAVKGKADQLLDETKKAKEKARQEAEAAKQAELEKAQKNGDFEQLLKSSEQERATLAEQLNNLKQSVAAEKTRAESMKLAAELADGSNAELLSEFISRRLRYTEDGLKVLDANGDLTVSGLNDLKQEFANSEKFSSLLRGNQSSGGGAAGQRGSASSAAKEMARDDFSKLRPDQQMKFIKDGGKLID